MRLRRFIPFALLSAAIAGCDRAPDAGRTRQTRLEAPALPLRNKAPIDSTAQQIPAAAARGTSPLENSAALKLPIYELKMEPRDLRDLERNPASNETHPATFVADGEVYEGVQVRFRGEWARS